MSAPLDWINGSVLLADCGALKSLAGQRRKARWAVTKDENGLPLFSGVGDSHECTPSGSCSRCRKAGADYALTGLTLGPHPLAVARGVAGSGVAIAHGNSEVLPMDILSVPLAGCVCDNVPCWLSFFQQTLPIFNKILVSMFLLLPDFF